MSTGFDLLIRNGTVVTASGTQRADVAILGGRIAAIGSGLTGARREIDASGKLVLPGGIDSHCHIEQISSFGIMCADDFYSATVSAAFGGTTTTISFAAQHRDELDARRARRLPRRAREKAVIDYAFHLIVANPSRADARATICPQAIGEGLRSFKLFMTYDRMRLTDEQILDVLAVARARRRAGDGARREPRHDRLAREAAWWSAGNTLPRYHAICHARSAEAEAINRVIALAELVDAPILIVHVSTHRRHRRDPRGARARAEGLRRDLPAVPVPDREGPRPRRARRRDVLLQPAAARRGRAGGVLGRAWPTARSRCIRRITRPTASTRRASCPRARRPRSRTMANGVPGLELRLPLLFTDGVAGGRIDLDRVRAARRRRTTRASTACTRARARSRSAPTPTSRSGIRTSSERSARRCCTTRSATRLTRGASSPAGRQTVISRGDVIVDDGELHAERGRGQLLAREIAESALPADLQVPEVAQLEAWGTPLPAEPRLHATE